MSPGRQVDALVRRSLVASTDPDFKPSSRPCSPVDGVRYGASYDTSRIDCDDLSPAVPRARP